MDDSTKAKSLKAVVDGISIEVPFDVLNDWETLEILADLDNGGKAGFKNLALFAPRFFGKEQWLRIKDELRSRGGGKIAIQDAMQFILDAFNALNKDSEALKN